MKMVLIAFISILILTYSNTYSQENLKSYQTKSGDNSARNQTSSSLTKIESANNEKKEEPKKADLDYYHEVITHFHNILVHFPIALSLMAFFFTMINFKWKKFDETIKYLVVAAAVMCYPTIQSGFNQASEFKTEPLKSIVDLHLNLGILSLITIVTWAVFLYKDKLKKYAWLIAIACAIIICITGFFGGIIAHADL